MNYDTAMFPTREDALAYALLDAGPNSVLTVCRYDWGACPNGQVCPMCVRIVVTEGMTLVDLLAMIPAYRA